MNTLKKNHLFLGLASVTFLIHLYGILFGGFSYFRDELYYLESTRHLDFGYVDHPPLSIWFLWLITSIFGDSVAVIRMVPALLSSVVVFISCKTAQKLGGGSFAVFLTALSITFMPIFMGMNSIYSMNSFEFLFWAILIYLTIDLIDEPVGRKFFVIGLVMGLGMLNKISVSWFIAGFFVTLLISDKREWYKTGYPYFTGIIALLVFSPYIIWNFLNDFAHLEFMRNAVEHKYGGITRVQFLLGQIMMINPFNLVVAFTGLYFHLFGKRRQKFFAPAAIFITTFLILLINEHSKSEYLGAAYPAILAGGAVFLENQLSNKWLRFPIKYGLPFIIILVGLVSLPIVVPVLKVDKTIQYLQDTGFEPPSNEGQRLAHLPQHYADMHGWEELVESVKKVVDAIPGKDTLSILIVANNYGEASAINVIGRKYNLPWCATEHNSYWLWGFPKDKYDVYISIGDSEEDVKTYAIDPQLKGIHTARYAMPYENNLNIWVAYKLKYPLKELWKNAKHYE
jgi:hypothetical protein